MGGWNIVMRKKMNPQKLNAGEKGRKEGRVESFERGLKINVLLPPSQKESLVFKIIFVLKKYLIYKVKFNF